MLVRKPTLLLSLGVAASILVIFSLSENGADDVVREEKDVQLHVQAKDGEMQFGEGMCLSAPEAQSGSQLSVAPCNDKNAIASHRWSYAAKSGLVQLDKDSGARLCIHTDYVSEPEGALLSLQNCEAGSKRQAYLLDATRGTMHQRGAPQLCLHSVDAEIATGQPVLMLQCKGAAATQKEPPQMTEFLGKQMSVEDKTFEEKAIQKFQSEAEANQKKAVHYTVEGGQLSAQEIETQAVSKVKAGAMQAAAEKAAEQVHGVVTNRHEQDQRIKAKLAQADRAVAKVVDAAKVLHKSPPQVVLDKVKAAHAHGEQELLRLAEEEKTKLHDIISQVQTRYQETTDRANREAKSVKSEAHSHSALLQTQAQKKTAAVVSKARKDLRSKLKALSATLTESVDRRQRARAKLMKLRTHHADEVQLAQAALDLAKVNKATHTDNVHAREQARTVHAQAMRSIGFAQTILASRLKAIKTTERLAADKAELRSRAVMTEAEEALSRTTQTVLMALDDADAGTKLEDIVGKEATVRRSMAANAGIEELLGTTQPDMDNAAEQVAANPAGTEFDAVVEPAEEGVEELDNDELVGNHAALMSQAPADSIYTSKMHRCQFPFVYNGNKLYHCKKSVHGSWCATHVDEKGVVKEWDYCVLNQRAVGLAKQAAMEAAKIEIKRVLEATGAKLTPEALKESLKAAAAAQATPGNEPVAKVAKKSKQEGDLKSRAPVMGRVQAADQVDKIIDNEDELLMAE